MSKKALNIAIISLALWAVYSSCANMGMPKGGKKDITPPVVLRSTPAEGQTNVKDNVVRIYFNEFIQVDNLNEKFVVSPPITKRPVFRTKGKSLVVSLNEDLMPNKTYSLDFKDGIADNNEKNQLRDFRLAFSTGETFDSLRLVGFVKDAFNLEPASNSLILLYSGKSDSLVRTTKPDYIAKTNSQGFFAVTNIPAGTYQTYAISDVDNNLKYSVGADSIAFLDSLIVPSATYLPERDTTITGSDTLVVFGKTRFYPDPIYFLRFSEKYFDLRLDNYERPKRNYIDLFFTESVKDTFSIEPLNFKPSGEWDLIQKSPKLDTLRVWLTDSTVYKMDTLNFKVNYMQRDSLGNFYTKNDTLKFYFTDIVQTERNKRKERRKVEEVEEDFILTTNARSGFDIYRDILIESPEPIANFDTSMVHLEMKEDTIFHTVPFRIMPDSTSRLKYRLAYPWAFGTLYKLTIDSAAVRTVYDLPSKGVETEFKTQDEEHYGKIIYTISNVTGPTIIQLLTDDDKENIVRSVVIEKDGVVTFPYLEPQKYLLKAIFDRNNNGVWDTGNLKERVQPEEVVYYLSVIKVRQNWDNVDNWSLPATQFNKKIIDEELEAEKLKNLKKKPVNKRSVF